MKALKRLLFGSFRGSDAGQSFVEYVFIIGACALVGIAGFTRYGQVVKSGLGADARRIEGEGLSNTEGILGSLGADYNELPGWCVKPNYCFAAGTPVQTEHGDRSIESIRIGDRIWARDMNTGSVALRPVLNTYRTPRVPVVDLELSAGRGASEHLFVTRNHLFWVEGAGWIRADALAAQPLWSTEGFTEAQLGSNPRELAGEPITVYNLEVSEFHSYFVGRGHVLVHNGDPESCTPGGGASPAPATSTSSTSSTSPPGRPPLECGEFGTYRKSLGGGGATDKERRDANGMERDHIPSGGALSARADRIFDQMISDEVAEKCNGLSSERLRNLNLELQLYKDGARGPLHGAVTDAAFATTIPIPLHNAGRTRGGKNQRGTDPMPDGYYEIEEMERIKQLQRDSEDLGAAMQADIAAYEKLLKESGAASKYGLPDGCMEQIEKAFARIRNKTDQDYEQDLTAVVVQKLQQDGELKRLLDRHCSGAPSVSAPGMGAP